MNEPTAHPHEWLRDEDGEIDTFAFDAPGHNGPHCLRCGEGFCHHCDPNIYDAECPEATVQPTLEESA